MENLKGGKIGCKKNSHGRFIGKVINVLLVSKGSYMRKTDHYCTSVFMTPYIFCKTLYQSRWDELKW